MEGPGHRLQALGFWPLHFRELGSGFACCPAHPAPVLARFLRVWFWLLDIQILEAMMFP